MILVDSHPRVFNLRHDTPPPGSVYVGRPTKWGNPFRISSSCPRALAITQYRSWLLEAISRSSLNINELKGKHLVCWCSPLPCHADILLELANA